LRQQINAIVSIKYQIDVNTIVLHAEWLVREPYRKGCRSVLTNRVNRNCSCSDPHLVNGSDEILDPGGIEVSDPESAKVQALQAVSELQGELGEMIEDWSGWHLNIVCPEGTLLYTLPLGTTLH
jgi:hypothetical protein